MKYAIVTGATGFVGSWLIRELLDYGYHVTALVRNKRKAVCLNKQVDVKEIDLLSGDENANLGIEECDVFYHLAWDGVSSEQKNNFEMQLKNIRCAVSAMKLAKKLEAKRFIVSGTVAEYVFCKNVMDLNAKQTPNDFYGAAKVSAHYFLDVLSRQIAQPYIWTVLPSTYGEGRKDDNILTYTIKELLEGRRPLYGDLQQMWDFVYVSDVVNALRLIGEHGTIGKTYGIGSGKYRRLKEYIIEIRDLINPDLPLGIGELPEMSDKSFSSCVNIYDLVSDVGYQPRVEFTCGIQRMINYFMKDMGN